MGSVKDLVVLKEPTEDRAGMGRFIFSDDYSVFDWGKMPQSIRHKGEALCLIGAYMFEKAMDQGIETHYLGLVDKNGNLVYTDDLEKPTNIMQIKLVRVVKPEFKDGSYDYSKVIETKKNYIIPIEVIYRNSLPPGSSVFRRLKNGQIRPEDLDLDHYPKPGEKLTKPILDVSTKFEAKDRYITWDEAEQITGLTKEEIEEIKKILLRVDNLITENVKQAGLTNEDGKIEIAVDDKGSFMVVDVFGTPDESRFSYGNTPVSKEIARIWYRGTSWYEEVKAAKEKSKKQGIENWQSLCNEPPRLSNDLLRIVEQVYQATANAITGKDFFDVPKLDEVVKEYKEWSELLQ